jgi:serine/threonine-protein kinase
VILNKKWEILDHISTGGMAEVYKARQVNLDRLVAIKVLSPKFLESFEGDEEEVESARARFHREVMAMAQVRHPNVLQVYDLEKTTIETEGGPVSIEYIVMEYIAGPNLRSTMPEEGLRGNERQLRKWIREIFIPILEGVETVHMMGIVHLDLKPENVLMDGLTPKIMDFGLAGGTRWRGLTQSHHVFGTLAYMAPEQFFEMGEADARADVYSLGKILYEAVAGRMTKETSYPMKTARLTNPQTPFLKGLDSIIQRATSEERGLRFASAGVFKSYLLDLLEEDFRQEMPPRDKSSLIKRHMGRWTLLLFLILTVALGGLALHQLTQRRGTPQGVPTETPSSGSKPSIPGQETKAKAPVQVLEGSLSSSIRGRDGASLRLVPAGELVLPDGVEVLSGKTYRVGPFYMDATEVTNHQYVEFLNSVLSRLKVEGRLVKSKGRIWLHLGEVFEGYEPLVYRQGRFHVQDPAYASYPVVRVTGYGAQAYARFFGRRLPTVAEWLLALQSGVLEKEYPRARTPGRGSQSEQPGIREQNDQMLTMHESMMGPPQAPPQTAPGPFSPEPVSNLPPNKYGIRGLEAGAHEWAVLPPDEIKKGDEESEFVVFLPKGEQEDPSGGPSFLPVPRYPWESFEEVGFRSVLPVTSAQKGKPGS